MRTLSLTEARRLAVIGQLLAEPRPASLLDVVAGLGKVQVDPTRVVERAERLTLWSRFGAYPLEELRVLLEERRELFEYGAHLIPTADLPLHRPAILRFPRQEYTRGRYVRQWLADNADFRTYILDELHSRGPLRSRDLDDRAVVPWRTGGWNDGKNLGRMLEILWHAGEIGISRREGSERVWDLIDRFLPCTTGAPPLPDEVVAIELMERQLRARGIAERGFGSALDYALPAREVGLRSLLGDEIAVPVTVDGLEGDFLAHVELLDALERPWQPRTTLLGPFDPLIADRARTEALFGFRFKLKIYKPAATREFGSYVLPILHGERLIGRIDPAYDRRRRILTLKSVYAEPEVPREAWPAIDAAIGELAGWLGAEQVTLPQLPAVWR